MGRERERETERERLAEIDIDRLIVFSVMYMFTRQ